ncbi:hypothetical protein [Pseudoxanthomonas mexicana]
MATTSVTYRTPYIGDLLIETFGGIEDPKRIESATSNVLDTIDHGVQGIGHLLWISAQSDEWATSEEYREAVADAGYLIKMLGELSSWARAMNSNAQYYVAKDSKEA